MYTEIHSYPLADTIAFRKTTEAFGGLSNMAAWYGLCVNDILIPSAEHLYQSARFPLSPIVQDAIIKESNPMIAKQISKSFQHLTRPDWDEVKFDVMQWCLEVKLVQNWNRFSALLNSTEKKLIVEYTPDDKVWGAKKIGNNYIGPNALGKLLMEVREKARQSSEQIVCVHPPSIPGFLLFNTQIGEICEDTAVENSGFFELELA